MSVYFEFSRWSLIETWVWLVRCCFFSVKVGEKMKHLTDKQITLWSPNDEQDSGIEVNCETKREGERERERESERERGRQWKKQTERSQRVNQLKKVTATGCSEENVEMELFIFFSMKKQNYFQSIFLSSVLDEGFFFWEDFFSPYPFSEVMGQLKWCCCCFGYFCRHRHTDLNNLKIAQFLNLVHFFLYFFYGKFSFRRLTFDIVATWCYCFGYIFFVLFLFCVISGYPH